MNESLLKQFLSEICRCGLDRLPLRIRNLQIPFFFAGFDDTHVFLIHAKTCMVSQFAFDELEPISADGLADLQSVALGWMASPQYEAALSLIESAEEVRKLRLKLPVTLSAESEPKTRHGHLNAASGLMGSTDSKWVCAVETVEGENVVFRYGLTRLSRALHDGKVLRMSLVPGQ
jgi:hypothetical protein